MLILVEIPVFHRHCTARSRAYHTLLHYKFRLLLKIRERLELSAGSTLLHQHPTLLKHFQLSQPSEPSQQLFSFNYSSSNSSSSSQAQQVSQEQFRNTAALALTAGRDRVSASEWRSALELAVEDLLGDTTFVNSEVRRFQQLIDSSEHRYGGREQVIVNIVYEFKIRRVGAHLQCTQSN